MTLDRTFAQPILKDVYTPDNVADTINHTNRLLSLFKKTTNASGSTRRIVYRHGANQGASPDYTKAKTAALENASRFSKVDVDYVDMSLLAYVSNNVIARCGKDEGAYVREITDTTTSTIKALGDIRARELVGAGWGDIGQIKSISGATVTLQNPRQSRGIEKGQFHVFAQYVNSGTLRSSTSLKVVSVDRELGKITYSANLSTVSAANDDFIFQDGHRQNTANPTEQCMTGIEAWIPPVGYDFSSDDFWNMDRSVDPTRLAGLRLDRSDGTPLDEVLQEADALVYGEGGAMDYLVCSPDTYKDIAVALGNRVSRQPSKVGNVGFSSLVLAGQCGDVTIISDRWVRNDRIYGLTMDSWELTSSGPLVKIENSDGNEILRNGNDGVEVHVVSRLAQVLCLNPSQNINIKI